MNAVSLWNVSGAISEDDGFWEGKLGPGVEGQRKTHDALYVFLCCVNVLPCDRMFFPKLNTVWCLVLTQI